MAKEKASKEFLILAVVSIVIVVALFVSAPRTTPSGYVVAHDVTDTVWRCNWDNGYKWEHTWSDGYTRSIPNIMDYKVIHCSKDKLSCPDGNVCNDANEGNTCVCYEQLPYTEQIEAGG